MKKKSLHKPAKKSVQKSSAAKKHGKKAAPKKPAPKRATASAARKTALAEQALLEKLGHQATRFNVQVLEETIRTLCTLLAKTCEYALDAADNLAHERVVEAEEDHGFRDEIEAIRVAAGISLREREPKSKLDVEGEEYVWIDGEDVSASGESGAQLDREIDEALVEPVAHEEVPIADGSDVTSPEDGSVPVPDPDTHEGHEAGAANGA